MKKKKDHKGKRKPAKAASKGKDFVRRLEVELKALRELVASAKAESNGWETDDLDFWTWVEDVGAIGTNLTTLAEEHGYGGDDE